jgi:hypothetical protein
MDINMYVQDQINQVNDTLDSLDNESLAVIGQLVSAIVLGHEGLGHYWKGTIDARLRARGACLGCGGDPLRHAHDMDGQIVPLDEDEPVAAQGDSYKHFQSEPKEVAEYLQGTLFDDPADIVPGDPIANMKANALEWGVTFADEGNLFGPVICDGCGQEYVSLEDRMLRPPGLDGCHFCQLKSRLG